MEVLPSPAIAIAIAIVLSTIAGWACYAHHRWQESVERERVVLAMKAAATPEQMRDEERDRLRLLREPWWAVWRWLPEQLGWGDGHGTP